MKANRANYPVATQCWVLGVSPSGFHAWLTRGPSARRVTDDVLLERIREIDSGSRGTYRAPRVHAELVDDGWRIGRKRVARLMREAGLFGMSRRKWVSTTQRRPNARPAPDLVERNFTVDTPDQLYVADITYVPTWAGFLFLAVVIDACTRRVVGWAMANHLRTELVLDALNMALHQRRPANVIHHSDQGTQLGLKESSQHWFVEAIINDPEGLQQGFANQVLSAAARSMSQRRH